MRPRAFAILALALAIGLGAAVAPYASPAPDGLERVAADHEFVQRARSQDSPVRGYAVPGIGNARVATGVAGFAGTLLVFGLGYGLATLRRRAGRIPGAA